MRTAPAAPSPVPAAFPDPGGLDARAVGVMVLLCLTWSLQQISLKAVSAQASPMLMVALRSGVALLLLAALMHRRGEVPGRARLRPGAVVGALFALEYLLVAEALRLTHAAHVVVFLYTAPVFAALGLHLRLPAERLGAVAWAGIACAFGGIALAFLGGGASGFTGALAGDALALLAGAAWGATTVAIRCSTLAAAPATETLLYQLAGACVLLLPAAWLTGQWHFDATPLVWAHLGFQSLVVSFASFLAWCWLLRRYLASRLGVLSFLTPLFGVALGALLLGEPLRPHFIAGSALVLAGIGIVAGGPSLARGLQGAVCAASMRGGTGCLASMVRVTAGAAHVRCQQCKRRRRSGEPVRPA
ncbi:DMT family transporter [Rubrivivax sp. RP6-9]|uniref:DMT family transporter n=1 Tax=Rubrivivax sp. RP6-9 TaxID=3415750 RepID=UPI003CC56D39